MIDNISYYDEDECDFLSTTQNLDMTSSIIPFLDGIKKGGLILDVGCGSGRDSKFFLDKGYAVIAIEPSVKNRNYASALLKQDVLNIKVEDITFEDTFDGVWACASLLHLDREKLKLSFNLLYKALKKGGIMYASFKCRDEDFIKDKCSFTCFTADKLSSFIKEYTPFQIISIHNTSDVREERKGDEWINIYLIKQ